MATENKISRLIKKYDINLYNYGSFMYNEYPHKSIWPDKFSKKQLNSALKTEFLHSDSRHRLLYVHIPFCRKQCLFCICYTIITRDNEMIKNYLRLLSQEFDLLKEFFVQNKIIPSFDEVHIGGGSPTILDEGEFEQLISNIEKLTDIKKLSRFSMEIDPRMVDKDKLKYYHSLGVNRLSFGIQDFNPAVQKAINRIQPTKLIKDLLTPEIRNLFTGINFDILCGLPLQTKKSFKETIRQAIKLSPDRIMVMFLTYSPKVKKHQAALARYGLPGLLERMAFFDEAAQILSKSGYLRIGVDHFAKSTDELAVAMKEKNMHWNSLGYGAGKDLDVIGLGLNSSSNITTDYYYQNVYSLEDYEKAVSSGKFPVFRGYKLNRDDKIRREVIHLIRNYFSINYAEIEKKYNIKFKNYFKREKAILEELASDGILKINDNSFVITKLGEHFMGLVCRAFDSHRKINS